MGKEGEPALSGFFFALRPDGGMGTDMLCFVIWSATPPKGKGGSSMGTDYRTARTVRDGRWYVDRLMEVERILAGDGPHSYASHLALSDLRGQYPREVGRITQEIIALESQRQVSKGKGKPSRHRTRPA